MNNKMEDNKIYYKEKIDNGEYRSPKELLEFASNNNHVKALDEIYDTVDAWMWADYIDKCEELLEKVDFSKYELSVGLGFLVASNPVRNRMKNWSTARDRLNTHLVSVRGEKEAYEIMKFYKDDEPQKEVKKTNLADIEFSKDLIKSFKKIMLDTPESQIDSSMLPFIKKWSNIPKAIEILEVLDYCIHGSLSSNLVVVLLETALEQAIAVEKTTKEEIIKQAIWRNK